MNVTLIGMGSGQPENLTLQGLAALRQADLILGARRLLAVLPAGCTENRAAAYRPDEVAELLQTSGAENAVLVYSGDTGFYSGASSMMEKLEALGVRARVLPGLSSIQLLAAALGRPWQGWNLVSAHGRTCDPVAECMQGRPTFFLTGGSEDPATLCAQLAAEGFGEVQGVVGQCLGTPEEKLFRGSVKELTVTNKDERQYLSGVISDAQIGTKSISCISIEVLEAGKGMTVATSHITYCTSQMYILSLIHI